MARKRREVELEDAKLNMTPMIDVTFQLLIFFLLATKFRKDEGLLNAHLPKDKGQAPVPHKNIEEELENVRIHLDPAGGGTRCKVGDRVVAFQTTRGGDEQLKAVLKGHASSNVPCIIKAHHTIPTGEVVLAFNAAVYAGFAEISFTIPEGAKEWKTHP